MLKHAIVGCGVISNIHASCLANVRGSKLVACMDVVPEKAEKLGTEHDVPWYTDRDRMLAENEIDVIHVCTPSGNHHEIAVWAAESGKHCFCEKPMDVTLEAMDMIDRAFKKSGTRYGGCFMNRYNPAAQTIKKAVEDGRFGRLTTATAQCMWWRSQDYYDSGDWRGTWELDGGGCLMNQGVHYVDLLQWLVGSPVKTIRAYTGLLCHERIAVEDTAVAILQFANGVLATLHGATSAYPGPHGTVEICGDAGNATYEGKITRWKFANERKSDETIRQTQGLPKTKKAKSSGSTGSDPTALGGFHQMFTDQFQEFSDAIRRKNVEYDLGTAEHRKAVEIILGIYESARRGGEEVKLPLTKTRVPVPMKLPRGYGKATRGADRPPLPEAIKAFRKKVQGKASETAKKARSSAKKTTRKAVRKAAGTVAREADRVSKRAKKVARKGRTKK